MQCPNCKGNQFNYEPREATPIAGFIVCAGCGRALGRFILFVKDGEETFYEEWDYDWDGVRFVPPRPVWRRFT